MLQINDLSKIPEERLIEISEAISRVLRSGWYVLGPEVEKFEVAFANYLGEDVHCVSLANGTDALDIAIRALEIGPGDEIINTANAGFYSTSAIRRAGATPIFCDVNYTNGLIDLEKIEENITERTRGIIVTHLYGQAIDFEKIKSMTSSHGIAIIEDCAQSHGARIGTRHTGTLGDIACFSFYPTKNLGAIGDGGAITTKRLDLANKIRKLRQYGWGKKYVIDTPGGRNSRLDEIQAAVLHVKLPYLDADNSHRRNVARKYSASLKHENIMILPQSFDETYVAHLYVMLVANRDGLAAHLKKSGIASEVHYPLPDHHQMELKSDPCNKQLPATEKRAACIITLPCHPFITDEQVDRVIHTVNAWKG